MQFYSWMMNNLKRLVQNPTYMTFEQPRQYTPTPNVKKLMADNAINTVRIRE